MSGRGNARAAAATRAAQDRMRRAVERLRSGDELADPGAVREATARLLAHLADRALDTHTHDATANLANHVLATPPGQWLDDARPLPSGYNNGSDRVR